MMPFSTLSNKAWKAECHRSYRKEMKETLSKHKEDSVMPSYKSKGRREIWTSPKDGTKNRSTRSKVGVEDEYSGLLSIKSHNLSKNSIVQRGVICGLKHKTRDLIKYKL